MRLYYINQNNIMKWVGNECIVCKQTLSFFYSLKVKSSIVLCIHKLGQERTCLEEK